MKSIVFLFIFLTGSILTPLGDENLKTSESYDLEISKKSEISSKVANLPFILATEKSYDGEMQPVLDIEILKDCFTITTNENGELAISDCASGGEGSSSCSSTYGDRSCETTCVGGYYACCNSYGTSCLCIANDIK